MMTSYMTLTLLLPSLVMSAPMKMPDNMIDMTHGLVDNMPAFPGHVPYTFTINVRGEYPLLKNPDIYIEMNTIRLSEHTATHVDAPAHFAKGKWRIHQIPNRNFVAPGVVIDIRDKVAKNPDAQIDKDDLKMYEEKYGQIPNRAFVLQNAGWEERWMNTTEYLGRSYTSSGNVNISSLHWPGFSLDATKWLVEERDIVGIGTDAMSFDLGNTKDFPVHRYLLENNRIGFEMVANLSRIPPAGATIYAFPIKIMDGSGAPVRMFAMWSNGAVALNPTSLLLSCVCAIILLLFRH
ncbi:isatin hydrolase-like isoform X2 [Lineus longissimus]|uniref:isatin hydrolase-like isoform X2 n=1 Tax=Lineus longissimus TaxID=88925 RepID=UPI002B4F4FDD